MFKKFIIFSFVVNFSSLTYAAESKTWENYYQNTLNISDPHRILLLAQKYFKLENKIGGMAPL